MSINGLARSQRHRSVRRGALTAVAILVVGGLFIILVVLGLRTPPADPYLVPRPAPAPAAHW